MEVDILLEYGNRQQLREWLEEAKTIAATI